MIMVKRIWFYWHNRHEVDAFINHALMHDLDVVKHQDTSMGMLWRLKERAINNG